jgi:hypothetical protein
MHGPLDAGLDPVTLSLDPVTLRCSRLLARAAKGDGHGRLRGQRERAELSNPNGLFRLPTPPCRQLLKLLAKRRGGRPSLS